jgi:hypothetical protein
MKLSLRAQDQELQEIENRIALERLALEDAVTGCTNSLRETVSSPKTLLALAGIGFVVGKLMFGKKAPPQQVLIPQKTGALGLLTGLAGTAVSLMQPGLSGSIARWAAQKAFGAKAAPVGRAATDRHPVRPSTAVTPTTTHVARRSELVS